jgi:hypothetical protein
MESGHAVIRTQKNKIPVLFIYEFTGNDFVIDDLAFNLQ